MYINHSKYLKGRKSRPGSQQDWCMIKISRGGRGGGSSERCLKWGGGRWGSLRDLSKNILNRGWVKAKVVRRGEGVLKVSPPLPPQKILIIHLGPCYSRARNIIT